jgi:selenocysteine lyase/cysteine desulfurase
VSKVLIRTFRWLYVPRGCAVFYVPVRNQEYMRTTLPTSHGFAPFSVPGVKKIPTPIPGTGVKSAFVHKFEFMATIDASPYLCIPAALAYRKSLGGELAIMEYCSNLAKTAAKHAAKTWGTEILENSTSTLGNCCMSNIRLPLSFSSIQGLASAAGVQIEGLENVVREWISKLLVDEYHTFIIVRWYAEGFWVRFSGQVYLEVSDFEWGTKILSEVCERVLKGEFLGKGGKEENLAERVDALQ